MGIELCEYVNFKVDKNDKKKEFQFTEGYVEDINTIVPGSLMVEIEGIHGYPHVTRNYTRYMPEGLKKSAESWVSPYKRPMIKFHNEHDGETIGRIIRAEYKENSVQAGIPTVHFIVNIPKEKDQQDIKDGTLSTVSIGIIAHDARCSICGTKITEEDCEHYRGATYDGKVCYWDIYDMEAKELSYVIVPSDVYAKNIKFYPAVNDKNSFWATESLMKDFKNKGGKEKVGELEKAIEEIRTNLAVLVKNEFLTKESFEEFTNKFSESFSINNSDDEIAKLKETIGQLEISAKDFEEKIKIEMELKKAAEEEISALKNTIKENLINQINYLRTIVGKEEIEKEDLQNRAESSLQDTIKDLFSEIKLTNIQENSLRISSVALGGNDDVEKETTTNTVDVKEKFSKMFDI